METLDILTNYGALALFVVLAWILMQEILNETKENRGLYQQSVKEFNKTVLDFNLTIKEISNEVKSTNNKIDGVQHDIEELKTDVKDLKNSKREEDRK